MQWSSTCFDCGASASSTVSQADADAKRDAACTCGNED